MCVENAGSGLAVVIEACQGIVAFQTKQQAIIERVIEARLRAQKTAFWLKVHGATQLANKD